MNCTKNYECESLTVLMHFVFNLHDIYQERHPGVKKDLPVYTESDIRGSESGLLVCDTM
jgi:hypothetical protein